MTPPPERRGIIVGVDGRAGICKRLVTVALLAVLGLGLGACGDDGGDEEERPAPPPSRTVSRAELRTMLTNWCRAQPGILRGELFSIMGQPLEELESVTASVWRANGYQFFAFYDTEDRVAQLYLNTQEAKRPKERAGCDLVRPPLVGPPGAG
jgi:hypothetical protein